MDTTPEQIHIEGNIKEARILSTILRNEVMARYALDMLQSRYFSEPHQHRLIYETLVKVLIGPDGFSPSTVAVALNEANVSQAYLAKLLMLPPASDDEVSFLIRKVREGYDRRQGAELSRELEYLFQDDAVPFDEIVSRLHTMSQQVGGHRIQTGHHISSIGDDFIKTMYQPPENLPTGFFEFDELFGGLDLGEVSIIVGGSGTGKTSCAISMAHNIASSGVPVVFFGWEMGKKKMYEKLLAHHGNIPYEILNKRDPARIAEWHDQIIQAKAELDELPIHIFDQSMLTNLDNMMSTARTCITKFGAKLFIVDYVQRVPTRPGASEYEAVTETSMALQSLAAKFKVAVLELSQTSKDFEKRGDLVPKMADLRGSGQVAQDAGMIMFLLQRQYGQDFYETTKKQRLFIPFHETHMHILKNRYSGGKHHVFTGIGYISEFSKYVNVVWDDAKYQPMVCPNPDCGSPHIKYTFTTTPQRPGYLYCPQCQYKQDYFTAARSGLLFIQHQATLFGRQLNYEYCFLNHGYDGDTLIKNIQPDASGTVP